MADELTFFGWNRAGGTLQAAQQGGRLHAKVPLRVTAVETGAFKEATLEFDFLGPPDVVGLLSGAIGHMSPAPGATAAEETMVAYVELGAPDLPWRYTPVARDGDGWRPWIVLVVGATRQVVRMPGGRVAIASAVLKKHPLTRSARCAHVQRTNTPALPQPVVSRLISEYDLDPNTDYIAVVVPAFTPQGQPSWDGSEDVELPVYHSWRFRTGDAGDFKDLALRLRSRSATDPAIAQLGRSALEYPLPDVPNVIAARSALVPVAAIPASGIDPDGPTPADVAAANAAMRLPAIDAQGRRVVQMPRYGDAWFAAPAPAATGWMATLNDQPRHRVAAGLGLWCGVAKQDLIADAARDRAGGLFVAAQRIRGLTAGLAAGGSLWGRRLPSTPEARLAVFGPSLARVAASGVGNAPSVLAAISDPDNARTNGRPLPPALLSSAARRVLRPGTARSRFAKPGACAPESILRAANDCARVAPERRPAQASDRGASQRGLPHADFLAAGAGLGDGANVLSAPDAGALGNRLQAAGFDRSLLDAVSPGYWPEMMRILFPISDAAGNADAAARLRGRPPVDDAGLGRWREALPRIEAGIPRWRCRPADLRALDAILVDAFQPRRDGSAARRVLATIDGLDPAEPFAPPEICPDLDLPAWRFLRDEGRNWLLLGREAIAPDDVVALSTNARFVNAFLAGLNTQALGEMRWRNIPVRSGCTPLRRFWDRIAKQPGGAHAPTTDIVGIARWNLAERLGHPNHSPDPASARQLVLVFRTELFRRYPRTLVYLASATLGADGKPDWMKDADFTANVAPGFTGEIDADVVFFGFSLQPEDLATRWVVVEEAPPGYRFRVKQVLGSAGPDGGKVAQNGFAPPTRVLFRGDTFLE